MVDVATAITCGFAFECMSSDRLYLSMSNARNIMVQLGISDEDATDMANMLLKRANVIRKSNPVSGMF